MQELISNIAEQLYLNPIPSTGSLLFGLWLALKGLRVSLRTSWRALAWLCASAPPSELAAKILAALDGETVLDGSSVVGLGIQVWPLRKTPTTAAEQIVYVGGRGVDGFLSDCERHRIVAKANEVRQQHLAQQRQEELASLLSQVGSPQARPTNRIVYQCGNSSKELK